jgi:hypothetical protein
MSLSNKETVLFPTSGEIPTSLWLAPLFRMLELRLKLLPLFGM